MAPDDWDLWNPPGGTLEVDGIEGSGPSVSGAEGEEVRRGSRRGAEIGLGG